MRPCRLAALTILYVSAAVCVLGITPARADVDPALLVRQPDGAYAPAPLVGLPGTVAEQPCLKYNNFWCLKGTQWRGQTKVGTHRLAVFADPADAARAFAITLQAYRFKHGLSTPTQIMSRFILNPGCLKGGRSKAGCASMWKLVDRHAGRLAGARTARPRLARAALARACGALSIPPAHARLQSRRDSCAASPGAASTRGSSLTRRPSTRNRSSTNQRTAIG